MGKLAFVLCITRKIDCDNKEFQLHLRKCQDILGRANDHPKVQKQPGMLIDFMDEMDLYFQECAQTFSLITCSMYFCSTHCLI